MNGLRILDLAPATVAVCRGHDLCDFDEWCAQVPLQGAELWFPRSFMSYDTSQKEFLWAYVPPAGCTDFGSFIPHAFPGGLYAVHVCRDEHEADVEAVYAQILAWAQADPHFAPDEQPGVRDPMLAVITTDALYETLGYRQMDLYVPIRVR